LLFGSGFLANAGVVAALARPGDTVFCDELSHPSILDGCRLSGAEIFAYDHCDIEHLAWGIRQADGRGALIVTDSVFSVDGDVAPLPEVVEVAARHRLRLVVDESRGIGAIGPGGRGALADTGLEDQVDAIVGTLGNALGSYGAFVACDRPMARYLVSAARTLQFSAAPSPPAVGGALAALDLLEQRPRLVDRLRANASALRAELDLEGFDMSDSPTQILSIVVGEPRRAVRICEAALARGVFAQTVRPPAVAPGWSRLRLAVMASHRPEELRVAARIMGQVARAAGFEPARDAGPPMDTAELDEPQLEPSRGVFDFEARAA
jgi:glycine C-acetyltransferase/8-amino-7-oxononanoate synthase